MLVKIGNLVFSSADQPIMVVMSKEDIAAINDSADDFSAGVKHVSAPENTSSVDINNLMNSDNARRVFLEDVSGEAEGGFVAYLHEVTEG